MATKINFTKDHLVKLYNMAGEALFNKVAFQTPMGQFVTIYDLLHTVTVNTLLTMKNSINKLVEKKESADEWTMTDAEQKDIAELKRKAELINLVIGWKKYQAYLDDVAEERKKLNKELEELKESQKTPEEKQKELEAKIKALDE